MSEQDKISEIYNLMSKVLKGYSACDVVPALCHILANVTANCCVHSTERTVSDAELRKSIIDGINGLTDFYIKKYKNELITVDA